MKKISRISFRKAVFTFAVISLTVGLSAPVGASMQSDGECRVRDRIWSGLWAGANLDFSSLGKCIDQKKGISQRPHHTDSAPFATPQSPRPLLQQSGLYVALGDSVAAGAGLSPTNSNLNNDAACGISSEAYPSAVATGLNRSYINIACSGATAGDLVTRQRIHGPTINAQLATAYAHGVPAVISITAGANDVRWSDYIRKCFASECGTNFDKATSRTLIAAMQTKLNFSLADIQRRSGNQPPTVVLTGYYKPISEACTSQNAALTSDEISWLNDQVDAMNNAISDVASNYSFARYAALDFTGHEICSGDSWLQGQGDPAPFHPTARGQQAIAEAVLAAAR